jgi:hypothetical protein
VAAGERLLFRGAAPTTAGSVPRAPVLSLASIDAEPRAGAPVRLRLALRNPTAADLALPAPDDARAPYFLEVTDPAGATVPVRIGPDTLEAGPLPRSLPPRGSTEAVLRFESTFARPGTYRLRTLFLGRPAGPRPPPAPDLELLLR